MHASSQGYAIQRPYKLNPTVIVVPQMSRLKPLSDQACLIGVEGARHLRVGVVDPVLQVGLLVRGHVL